MLREDMIDAVDAGRFHIYAAEMIDQGIEAFANQARDFRSGPEAPNLR